MLSSGLKVSRVMLMNDDSQSKKVSTTIYPVPLFNYLLTIYCTIYPVTIYLSNLIKYKIYSLGREPIKCLGRYYIESLVDTFFNVWVEIVDSLWGVRRDGGVSI